MTDLPQSDQHRDEAEPVRVRCESLSDQYRSSSERDFWQGCTVGHDGRQTFWRATAPPDIECRRRDQATCSEDLGARRA